MGRQPIIRLAPNGRRTTFGVGGPRGPRRARGDPAACRVVLMPTRSSVNILRSARRLARRGQPESPPREGVLARGLHSVPPSKVRRSASRTFAVVQERPSAHPDPSSASKMACATSLAHMLRPRQGHDEVHPASPACTVLRTTRRAKETVERGESDARAHFAVSPACLPYPIPSAALAIPAGP